MDFDEMIDAHLREKNPTRERVIGEYYPSELGGCLLALYFKYVNPKPPKPDLLRIFAAGNLVHEFAAAVFKSQTDSHEAERSMTIPDPETGLRLRGRLDDFFILRHEADEPVDIQLGNAVVGGFHHVNEKIVVEVKSIKNFDFLKEPKEEHVMQLMPYLLTVGAARGFLLYFEKATLKTKAFEVKYDFQVFDRLMARARIVHRALLETSALHRPEPDWKTDEKKKWQCRFCDYADECPLNANKVDKK